MLKRMERYVNTSNQNAKENTHISILMHSELDQKNIGTSISLMHGKNAWKELWI